MRYNQCLTMQILLFLFEIFYQRDFLKYEGLITKKLISKEFYWLKYKLSQYNQNFDILLIINFEYKNLKFNYKPIE